VRVEFVKESLVFTGEDFPMANLMLSVSGAFASLNALSSGIAGGKASPWPSGAAPTEPGKEPSRPVRAAQLVKRAGSGSPKALLVPDYGVRRETVCQYLRHAKLQTEVNRFLPATSL
jgi:hypothetical protein